MTAQDLKNSILQLAVQGKLVEQRAEEGTARELLQQVKAEKEQLIKNKKIKKEMSLPEITDEEIPFDIPKSWEWVRLGEISTYAQTKKKISPIDIKADMWSLDLEDIEKDTGIVLNKVCVSERKISGDKVVFKKGNILYSKLRPYLMKILVANDDGICTPELIPFDMYGDIFNEYIMWVLRAPHVNLVVNAVSYGVKMPRVSTETMINLLIPIPPLAEQHRIVAKIEEVLPYSEQYDKANRKLETLNKSFPEDMKKSILQLAMQGKLVEQRAEEGTADGLYNQICFYNVKEYKCKDLSLNYDAMDYSIPLSWEMVELNSILSFVDYRGKTPNKVDEGIFLITASNIKSGYMDYTRKEYISEEEYLQRQSRGVTECGDLLFTTEAPMGNAAVCNLEKTSCGQRIITFKEYLKNSVDLKLMMYFILSPQFQQQLKDNCTGTTAKGIKADKLKHLRIPLPPLEEQKRIVSRIEKLLPYCTGLVDSI